MPVIFSLEQQTTEHHLWGQQSYSLREEGLPQSGGPAFDAPRPPAWGKWNKQCVCWVSKVFRDAEDTFPASAGVDGGGGGSIVSKDFFSAMHTVM